MEVILESAKSQHTTAYIDVIIIFSKTQKQNLQNIEKVL